MGVTEIPQQAYELEKKPTVPSLVLQSRVTTILPQVSGDFVSVVNTARISVVGLLQAKSRQM
jgi:hypothetical protein